MFAPRRMRAALLVLVGVIGLGTAFVAVGPGGAALTATTVPNPDPPPVPPPPPAPVPPPPPPPAYVPPPPPPPPAYVPPPPPPPAYVPPRKQHRTNTKARAAKPTPAVKNAHRLVLEPPSGATPRSPRAAPVGAVHASGVATAEPSSRSMLPILFAVGLGLALLLLTMAFFPVSVLPARLGVLVDEGRESLIVGAAVCVVGTVLGFLIALMA